MEGLAARLDAVVGDIEGAAGVLEAGGGSGSGAGSEAGIGMMIGRDDIRELEGW